MKKIINTVILLFFCTVSFSQNTIKGTIPTLANQQVKLSGFQGFDTYIIDSTTVNENGVFQLTFGKKDYGMGYLSAEDNKAFIILLADNEKLKLQGGALASPETVKIISGRQNRLFEQYVNEHRRREQAMDAWVYLEKIYRQDSLFTSYNLPKQTITQEKYRIEKEDRMFLVNLDKETYLSWFLPVRKLVSSVATIAQYRPEEIPAATASFRKLDYTDPRLYKSGLLAETIEKHYWLIENSGYTSDAMYAEMKISIDNLIESLFPDEEKLNEITEYLFKFLEKRSLFEASEYLALKLLNENSCTINNSLAEQLESYRAMKIGNTAPDVAFNGDCFAPGYKPDDCPKKLSEIKSKYTVVVFGASWCPHCPGELMEISRLYEKWEAQGVEIVFVSLDEDKEMFKRFAGIFPFISICDYQKWESPVVKAYHVFATPTIYLLDSKREILLRPNSARQMDSWVDWYLVQGHRK